MTDIADTMVIASGTSDQHVAQSLAIIVRRPKPGRISTATWRGEDHEDGDWVLIDLNEMIVHVMLPRVRDFYGLEKLWDMTATKRAARA